MGICFAYHGPQEILIGVWFAGFWEDMFIVGDSFDLCIDGIQVGGERAHFYACGGAQLLEPFANLQVVGVSEAEAFLNGDFKKPGGECAWLGECYSVGQFG